jgi:hypothetical protein
VILFIEATEPSLENKHIEMSMQYAANLKAYPQRLLTTLYVILYMKMFIINNQIQLNLLNFKSHIEHSDINLIQKILLFGTYNGKRVFLDSNVVYVNQPLQLGYSRFFGSSNKLACGI